MVSTMPVYKTSGVEYNSPAQLIDGHYFLIAIARSICGIYFCGIYFPFENNPQKDGFQFKQKGHSDYLQGLPHTSAFSYVVLHHDAPRYDADI